MELTGQSVDLTLTWAASSNVTHVQHHYGLSLPSMKTQITTFATTTSGTTREQRHQCRAQRLALNTTYYWQVRAIGALGTTYADGGAWWSFTTYPVLGFVKLSQRTVPWGRTPR